MKFTAIFILFNSIAGFSLIALFFFPAFISGVPNLLNFWATSWPLGLVYILLLVVADFFFIKNMKMFRLLEREDWPALLHYLEWRILVKREYSSNLVKLMASTALLLADPAAVLDFERSLLQVKPAVVKKNRLLFSLARILSGQHEAAARFLQRYRSSDKPGLLWEEWYLGFALLLSKQYQESAEILSRLNEKSPDPLIAGLSSKYLTDIAAQSGILEQARLYEKTVTGKNRVLKALPTRVHWQHEMEKANGDLHIALLAKQLMDAANYIYCA